MPARGHHRTGAVALAGLALLAVGAGAPAHAADQPKPDEKPGTEATPRVEQERPEPDVTAPARPTLGEADVQPGGEVRIEVQAEDGSAVVVREGTEVVASASALGVAQTLSWSSGTGSHTFLVVATDAAGNASEPAPLTLDVDATPPAARRFAVEAGTERDSRSRWSVVTDPGTTYKLLVDGVTVQEGTAEGRTVKELLDLTDGNHEVRLELSDKAGNVRALTREVTVDIPSLWVVAKDVSEENATERSFKVVTAPGTRGFLKIPGGPTAKFELPAGRAAVTVEVAEGSYAAPRIFVADSHDRKGVVDLAPFEVDLTAPALRVATDDTAAERGVLSATITAGSGDEVRWRLIADGGLVVMSGGFVADGTDQQLERPVAEGSYELEVTATDAQGNRSVERATSTVAGVPMINPDVVPALTITLVLWVLVGAAFVLRRRRQRRRALAGASAAGKRGLRTKRARLVAAHTEAVAAYEQELAEFQREDATWQQRRAELEQLVAVAKGGHVEVPDSQVALRPGERAFFALPATLVELQHQDGKETCVEVEDGELLVTDRRVAFAGSHDVDWELADLVQLRHVGQDITLLPVAGRDGVLGVAYDDGDLVRFHLQLALARLDGSVRSVRAMLEQGVRSHELRRPLPPTPVGPAPQRRGGRRKAAAAQVGAASSEVSAPVVPVTAPAAERIIQRIVQPVVHQELPHGAAPRPTIVAQADRSGDRPADRELLLHG